jgi:hypothetical protein
MDGLRNWRSKAADKINPDFWSSSDEIRLFWTILRRGPRGYRLGEYLHAVEQHRSKMRVPPNVRVTPLLQAYQAPLQALRQELGAAISSARAFSRRPARSEASGIRWQQ